MPRYPYKCPNGHETELVLSMTDEIPATTTCMCEAQAERIWLPPVAIIFKGPGFYQTDVKGRVERKRRKNSGDRLPSIHDPQADFYARHI